MLRFARKNIWSRENHASDDESSTTAKKQRKTLPVSAGALAVQLCRRTFEENGLDYEELFGLEEKTKAIWDPVRQRLTKKSVVEQDEMRSFHEHFAIKCFHGGRNECLQVGISELSYSYETFLLAHDYDLIGAYPTGMVSMLTKIGFETTVDDVKNASRNKSKLVDNIVPRTPRALQMWGKLQRVMGDVFANIEDARLFAS